MGVNAYSKLTPTDVVVGLLNQLHVKVTRASISEALQNHPYYPSLLSISDVLKQWKVGSTAIKADKSKLNELPLPFVAHINSKQNTFITITHVHDNYVEYKRHRGGGKC